MTMETPIWGHIDGRVVLILYGLDDDSCLALLSLLETPVREQFLNFFVEVADTLLYFSLQIKNQTKSGEKLLNESEKLRKNTQTFDISAENVAPATVLHISPYPKSPVLPRRPHLIH